MRILVTGAYGFIGSHIVGRLRGAGHRVVGGARDVALGALLLIRWRVALVGATTIVVTLAYLAFLGTALPELWLDPLGPLTKTIPLVAATLVMIAIEDDR